MEQRQPLVSICCTAYNHEPYIRQCLDGLLMQQCDFDFEVLVHDDASTDATAAIIREYEARYPDRIHAVYQTENQFSKGVQISQEFQYPHARGRYLAICEGDDYWTDPLKLQRQVDFLETHPDYGMCYTQCFYYDQAHGQLWDKARGGRAETAEELVWMNTIPTLTVVARTELVRRFVAEIRPETRGWLMGDYPMWLYLAAESKIRFMPEVTGVYRVLNNSVSHAPTIEKQCRFIDSALEIQCFFQERYRLSVEKRRMCERAALKKMKLYARAKQWRGYVVTWKEMTKSHPSFIFNGKSYAYLTYFLL